MIFSMGVKSSSNKLSGSRVWANSSMMALVDSTGARTCREAIYFTENTSEDFSQAEFPFFL